jgi:exosome complex exonuclease DIS3/RRP44
MSQSTHDFTQALIAAFRDDQVIELLGKRLSAKIAAPLFNECKQLREEVTALRETVNQLHKQLEIKDQRITDLEKEIDSLKSSADDLEQYSRRTSPRVAGLHEEKEEDPCKVAMDLINDHLSLDPPISIEELDRVHRVGPKKTEDSPTKPRKILIKFTTYRARRRVFAARWRLQSSEATKKIYINEDMTGLRAKLLWEARKLKHGERIEDCWSSDGNILLKDAAEKIHRIKTLKDLSPFAE